MMSSEEKRARFEASLRYGGETHSVEDVVERVRKGLARYWEHRDGTIVSEVYDLPLKKVLNLWVLSGDLHDIIELEPQVCDWGRSEGCVMATASGRRGWGRVGQPLGWRPHMFTFAKHL
jgi:hypothetical protein